MTRFEAKGYCWLLFRCDWWNPPEDVFFQALEDGTNFCIKCWEFKKC